MKHLAKCMKKVLNKCKLFYYCYFIVDSYEMVTVTYILHNLAHCKHLTFHN